VLLIHGVHSPYLWYAVVSRRLTGARTVVVVTDPPGVVLASDGAMTRRLKKLDIRLVTWALRSVDGVVVLTEALARDFTPRAPRLVLDGILAASASAPAPESRPHPTFRVMYAGRLEDGYGVDRLVGAVRALPVDDVALATFGRGPLGPWIDSQSAVDQRIDRLRFAPRDVVLAQYGAADLLVQPRPVDQVFVRYSFPSKLLEYLASGTPVLSTRLAGIPAEYEPYLYWIDDDSVAGIARALQAVMAVPAGARAAKARAAAQFVVQTRSSSAQGARIRGFLTEVLEPRTSQRPS
jgi:glycosyltransferase involved in cell wall biosynthesis